ncbi:hypothetical protein D3C76_495440 [compost metagenome]
MFRYIFPGALLILMLMVLTGCASNSVDTPLYEGHTEISLNDLKEGAVFPNTVDAVFIGKDYLSEAAEPEYAQVYKKAGVPFFFIESMKSYIPFVYEDLSYEEVPDMQSGMYITGYYESGGKMQYWGYGLYNDKVNSVNIKDAYSRIFTTIASLAP